jgi:hypothetical protein
MYHLEDGPVSGPFPKKYKSHPIVTVKRQTSSIIDARPLKTFLIVFYITYYIGDYFTEYNTGHNGG